MSFESDVLLMVRHLIDDIECDPAYTYSDDRLLSLIFVSASLVNMDLGGSYTINLSGQSISPTPDADFNNLVALKAACRLLSAIAISYARNDFKVQDGPSIVDIKGISDKLKDSSRLFCEDYTRQLQRVSLGGSTYGIVYSTPDSDS
jgi:hypothetical protein